MKGHAHSITSLPYIKRMENLGWEHISTKRQARNHTLAFKKCNEILLSYVTGYARRMNLEPNGEVWWKPSVYQIRKQPFANWREATEFIISYAEKRK